MAISATTFSPSPNTQLILRGLHARPNQVEKLSGLPRAAGSAETAHTAEPTASPQITAGARKRGQWAGQVTAATIAGASCATSANDNRPKVPRLTPGPMASLTPNAASISRPIITRLTRRRSEPSALPAGRCCKCCSHQGTIMVLAIIVDSAMVAMITILEPADRPPINASSASQDLPLSSGTPNTKRSGLV